LENISNLTTAYALPGKPKGKRRRTESAIDSDGSTDNEPVTDTEPKPASVEEPHFQRRRKSRRQIEKELQRISEHEKATEIKVNDQLGEIVAALDNKVRAQWLEFPERVIAHGRTLTEIGKRLKLNTPTE
jgi:hypothetical protein